MKHLTRLFFVCLAAFGFTSCEDVVQVKLDEGSKLYVIDAFINNLRQDQVVKITNNSSYFSSGNPSGVSGANVVLVDLTDNRQFTFTHTSNGNYVFSGWLTDTIAKVGHDYKLIVEIDGSQYLADRKSVV